MKTGRRGVDPTKPNTQQEPPQKKYYTQEEYDKNEAVKASNKSKKEKYESDLANYNKAMNLYNEGISTDVDSSSLSQLNKGTTVKGKKATFDANKDRLSAAKSNAYYDKAIKSGEYVDINDPSISDKNRYYLKGSMSLGSSNSLGTVEKTAVPKSVAFDKDLNFKKIYGEDFNPYEFRKASKSGKIEDSSIGKAHAPIYGVMEKYKTPEQSDEPVYEKEQNIGLEKVIPKKIALLKPKIDQPKGKLIGGTTDKGEWEGPKNGTKYRTKYSLPDINTTNKAKSLGRFVKSKIESIGKDNALSSGLKKEQGKARLIQGKAGREEILSKAYFGAGYGNQPLSTINESKAELQGKKKELKARIRANEGDVMTQQGRKAELKDVKAGIKQAKLAGRYLKKYDRTYQGANQGSGKGGKIGTFTGEALTGFESSRQNTYNPNANKNALFKSQLSNPANKNTITDQQNKIKK